MANKKPTVNQLKAICHKSITLLYERDGQLIQRGVHEAAIAHRLAIYLEVFLHEHLNLSLLDQSDYDVDAEYDKNGKYGKRLVQGENGKRPDIIIHHRGDNDNNLLIIEIKKNQGIQEDANDDRKLCGATDQGYDFQFTLGLFVNFMPNQYELTWYRNGKKSSGADAPNVFWVDGRVRDDR